MSIAIMSCISFQIPVKYVGVVRKVLEALISNPRLKDGDFSDALSNDEPGFGGIDW